MATGISAVPDGTLSVFVGSTQDCVLGYLQSSLRDSRRLFPQPV